MITYLSLGTNLGDKYLNLFKAITLIVKKIGNLSAISSIYESKPYGFQSTNLFMNIAIKVITNLQPIELMKNLQEIEKQMGRTKQQFYQDRIIDIDIILYEDLVYTSKDLTIPHHSYKKRDFVMKPLKEIIGCSEVKIKFL
ncbi:MAG: 2-amino-4-hydroxy-6-hydroxymethyldihydropteridine diphosphokinase [Bacteroidales bacterium OttesenSCG-928-I14]|jgi:2-amino-4-hydroxy-6-hydroxymethyldihydropteridine diphosphokinase|nr:2-amino-4-hydroxy-6-hydroxymethyldihydropteridine diphosphokinase [Bacteroidales bacterium OttesenSCG-928-I14]